MPLYPFPNPNPAGWSGIQPVTAEQITQINANAAAAADGSRWTDYAHLKNWRHGSWGEDGTRYTPGYLTTQTFVHWIPGPDCWLTASDFGGDPYLFLSRDNGFHFRLLPTPSLDRKPWLAASKESTGETIVVMNPSGVSDNWRLLSFTITPPFLNAGTVDDEIGAGYSTIDMGFSPGMFVGLSVQDIMWVPEMNRWMLDFVASAGGIKTSTDLATWTNRAVGVFDGTNGPRRIVGNGDGTFIATNSGTLAQYGFSDDGGDTWQVMELPWVHGAGMRAAYVSDLGLFVVFMNNSIPGLVYTSPTGAEGDWTVAETNISVKDCAAAGRVLLAIMDPTGDDTNQQVVASVDGAQTWFRCGLDLDTYNAIRFNGKQAAVQCGSIPGNGTDSGELFSMVAG